MSRRTRRMRRRLRRGGARREPLLLVADDGYRGETLEALARLIYRYRSELVPFTVAVVLWLAGLYLHGWHPLSAPFLAVLTVLGATSLALPQVTRTLRRDERTYAAGVAGVAGLWLTLATWLGPTTTPFPGILLCCTVIGGIPWWSHRRRRARVRVERTLEAWPHVAEAVGLPGSRVMSAVVDLWGWRARIGLRHGQTVTDVINKAPALESGLGTRPGAVRVEPDPARADHALIRVLDADPHARAIPWPGHAQPGSSVTQPLPLGLYEDATRVTVALSHRHGLIGGVAGAGKSGVLNVIMATLVACPDVVLWGIDLKGGMELGPWASCLDRIATTPQEAAQLLAEAVEVLEARARRLAHEGHRLWEPKPDLPALVIVIDEYAELSEQAAEALTHADSIARRGRAVAVTLLVATQRPTQKAMGAGALRSQMDVRIALRVRERRDVDLVLGQGMLGAGWNAHMLDAPGKFLVSTPELTVPRRARAFLLKDGDVQSISTNYARHRPILDDPSQQAADDYALNKVRPSQNPADGDNNEIIGEDGSDDVDDLDAEFALSMALTKAPERGVSVPALMEATGMRRTWVYDRLHDLAEAGRARQVSRGRWRAVTDRPDEDRR